MKSGDSVLVDKTGKAVMLDFTRPPVWTAPKFERAPTQAELDEASKPYFGRNSNNSSIRTDGTQKGNGWLGPHKRPDGRVSTELSVQYDDVIGGKPFPLMVPTLTKDEVKTLLELKDGERAPKGIANKAIAHAEKRVREGKSPFKD